MAMHKLDIKLKQHTPLIHFQHDQEGATLRASEVKPKLDRFIIKHGFHDSFDECKEFLVGYNPDPEKKKISIKTLKNKWSQGYRALNYRIKVEASSVGRDEYMLCSYIKDENRTILNNQGITAITNTPFFAQEKQNSQIIRNPRDWDKIEKKGIIDNGLTEITIVSQSNDLVRTISKYVQAFFLATNFGTRQSKGFGCFSPIEIMLDGEAIVLQNAETLLEHYFQIVYKKTLPEARIDSILSTINDDYRLLKSGRTRPYAKSKLMLYARSLDNNVGWDKKYIKANTYYNAFENANGEEYNLLCKEENKHNNYAKSKSYNYFRALLGLAEQFEFLLENPPMGDKKNKMIVKVRNNEIQRYQSPLLFKVLDNVIYLLGNDVTPEILNKPFQFLVSFQKDSFYKDEPVDKDGTPIFTPHVFSLKDFIAFAMKDSTNGASLGYRTIKG